MPPIAQTKDHDPVADFAGALSRVFARMIAHRATVVSTEKLADDLLSITVEATGFRRDVDTRQESSNRDALGIQNARVQTIRKRWKPGPAPNLIVLHSSEPRCA
jgi:hypothetical protein